MFRKQIHLENYHEEREKDAGKKFPQVVLGFEASVPLHYGLRADILKKSYQKMFNFEN